MEEKTNKVKKLWHFNQEVIKMMKEYEQLIKNSEYEDLTTNARVGDELNLNAYSVCWFFKNGKNNLVRK